MTVGVIVFVLWLVGLDMEGIGAAWRASSLCCHPHMKDQKGGIFSMLSGKASMSSAISTPIN